jgi:anti-sigma factor RsiW
VQREIRCQDVQRQLSDYVDGQLDADAYVVVEAHVEGCVACRREARELEETVRLLRGMPDPEIPPMIAANVMRRIRAGESRPGMFERIRRGILGVLEPSFVLPASAIAMAALVFYSVQAPPGPRWDTPTIGPTAFAGSSAEWEASGGRAPAAADVRNAQPVDSWRGPRVAAADGVRRLQFLPVPVEIVAGPGATVVPFPSSLTGGRGPSPAWGGRLISGERWAGGRLGGAMPVAGPVPSAASFRGTAAAGSSGLASRDVEASSGLDVRDQWLAAGLDRPEDFARFLAAKSLAEQELWVERLATRARDRGLLGELIEALNATDEASAHLLAEDFRATRR